MIVIVCTLAVWLVVLAANARLHHPRARMLPRLPHGGGGRHRKRTYREGGVVLRIGTPPEVIA